MVYDADSSILFAYSSLSHYDEHISTACDPKYSIFVFNSLLTAFGLVSGALMVVVICFKSNLRSSKYLLLNNLLTVFLLQLILNGIVYTEEAYDPCWRVGTALCVTIKIVEPVLTNAVVIFLVAVGTEQFNRYKGLTRPEHSDVRGIRTASLLWLAVLFLCIPEIINSVAHTHSTEVPMNHCAINALSLDMYYILTIKQFFLEYFILLPIMATLLIAISVLLVKSRRLPTPVSTNAPVRQHPKYFALVAAITIAYAIGYFPKYSFMLANFIFRVQEQTESKEFWGHLFTIDTIFALIPPAFVPLFVLILSRTHLETVRDFFHHIKVRLSRSGWRHGTIEENTGEDRESLDIGMRRVNNHSF